MASLPSTDRFVWDTVTAFGEAAVCNADIIIAPTLQQPAIKFDHAALLSIQSFRGAPLTRVVLHHHSGIISPFDLPVDQEWTAVSKRVKSKRSKKKAIEVTLTLPRDNTEKFEQMIITMPFDGDNGLAVRVGLALEESQRPRCLPPQSPPQRSLPPMRGCMKRQVLLHLVAPCKVWRSLNLLLGSGSNILPSDGAMDSFCRLFGTKSISLVASIHT